MAAPACDSDEKREIAFLRITTSNSVESPSNVLYLLIEKLSSYKFSQAGSLSRRYDYVNCFNRKWWWWRKKKEEVDAESL